MGRGGNLMQALLDNLKAKGVLLYLDGENLKWKSPRGALTDRDRELVKRHKADLVRLLSEKARDQAMVEFSDFYADLAANHSHELGEFVRRSSSWHDELYRLEADLQAVWTRGGDGREEFERIKNHWRQAKKIIGKVVKTTKINL